MNYRDISELSAKEGSSNVLGISAFVKEQIELTPEEHGIALSYLAAVLMEKFTHITTRQQAYARINQVLKSKTFNAKRMVDESGRVYIGR